MRAVRYSALVLFAASGVAVGGHANADSWKVARHDAGRTGASLGASPLDSAHVAWRTYTGGRPSAATVKFGLDDESMLVASLGGRFVAKDAITQSELWSSPLLGTGSVVEMADLDGDGFVEVVVQTASQAHVLNGTDGSVSWSSPLGAIEVMGAVRVRDLDGDNIADVYLDNGIGAKPGTKLAAAYSFAGGVPTEIWSLPVDIAPQSVNSGTDSLVDLNQDGVAEVLLPSWDQVLVVSGQDGSTITSLVPAVLSGHPYPQSSALAAQLDGAPGLEVLVVQPYSGAINQMVPGVAAYDVDVASGQSTFLWSADIGTFDGELVTNADLATDVDGDGIDEVVLSYRSSANGDAWVTEIRSGATGNVIDQIPDARFEGAAPLDDVPGSELVVASSSGLRAYSADGGSMVQVGSTLPGLRALSVSDPALRNSGPLQQRLAVVPGASSTPTLYVGTPTGSPDGQATSAASFDEVVGLQLTGGGFSEVGSYSAPVGAVTGTIRADFSTRPYEQLALATSEGLVVVLNRALEPTNGMVWFDCDPIGSFVGGSLSQPPVASSDEAGPFVVLPNTAVGAAVVDARFASLVLPAFPRWWQKSLKAPSIIDIGGLPHLVGVEDSNLVARRTDTGLKTAEVLMPSGWIWGSPIPLTVAGQTDPIVGVDWRVDGMQIAQTAVDFSSSSVLWVGAPIAFGGYFGSSAGDLDGDGNAEWFSLSSTLNRRDAATGAVQGVGSFPMLGYALPLLAPFTGPTNELLLQSGGQGAKLLADDYSVTWESNSPEAVNGKAGTRVSCAGGASFITPAVQSAFLRSYDGASGALLDERVFAGGQAFASTAAALEADQRPGEFSDASSLADLGGAGPAVLVGSSDGFLYAVDACSLDLRWAANIGASVGEPIVADVDDDGDAEIVVSAADGFVYGLDVSNYPAPIVTLAAETDELAPGELVDFEWPEVEGASSYEVALVSPDQRPVWTPAYRSVATNSTSIDLTGALAGRPYRLAVRAVGDAGFGSEGFSPALSLVDLTAPELSLAAAGGETATLSLELGDDVALDHYVVRLGTDDAALVLGDALVSGKSQAAEFIWAPPADLWGAEITISVQAVDSARLSTTRTVLGRITEDGIVVFDAGLPGGLPDGDDIEGDDIDSPHAAGGCACSLPDQQTGGGSSVGLLLGLAVALRRRRNRRG